MRFINEFVAICLLIIGFAFEAEVGGGSSEQKKTTVTAKVISYLTTPDGFYLTNKAALTVIEFMLKTFLLDLIVRLLHGDVFLGKSDKPSK